MTNRRWIIACERAHGLNGLPIRDRHELGIVLAVLPEGLDAERRPDQQPDTGIVVIGLVFVNPLDRGPSAPDARDDGFWLGGVMHAMPSCPVWGTKLGVAGCLSEWNCP